MSKNWSKENNQDKAIKLILFIISPFLSTIYSVRRMNTKSSYRIFFLFAVFFGMSFTISLDHGFDGSAYIGWFEDYSKTPTNFEYLDGLEGFLTFDEGKKDYYFDTLAFYISRFTDNYHVMFMFAAIVFAFFALKSLRFLTKEEKFDFSIASLILVYIFMQNDIFNINGLRFWTAAWIGVYSIFQVFRNNNDKYFILIFLTPFFHGSFWIFIAVVLMARFLRKFEKTWVILFFASFFIGSIALELLRDASDILPAFMQRMISSYTDAEYVELRTEGGSGFIWVARLMDFLVRFSINFMVYLFIRNSKMIKANSKTRNLYLFILVWMTFVNFVMPVPSLGGRYFQLAFPIVAYIWMVNFKDVKYKDFLYALPFVYWFVLYTQFTRYSQVLEPDFYISSPFYLIYKYLIAI